MDASGNEYRGSRSGLPWLREQIYFKFLELHASDEIFYCNLLLGPALGIRHLQAFLLFLCIVVTYIGRQNIAVAVVAMTNANTTNPDFPEYDWDVKEKSYVLSSFYWGYVVTQFPGGYICRKFGAKNTMLLGTFGSAVLSAVTPVSVEWGGWQLLCAIRVFQGLLQGVIFPCIHEHLAKWSPVQERNRLGALSHTGIECGTLLSLAMSGVIAEGKMGWPGISYVSAALGILWCLVWINFGANNATETNLISFEERKYIEVSLERDEGFHKIKIPIPWKAIFTSVHFYALLLARMAQGWGSSTLQAQLPSYMNGVLKMDIKRNALLSSLPYLVMWILSYVYLIAADVIIQRKVLSLTVLRKSINTLAFWTPAIALIAVGYLDADQEILAVFLMTISVGLNAGSTIGSGLNTIDLSPNHAGILMGIVNSIANFLPLLTPLFVGIVVTNKEDRTQWQWVFTTAALIYFVGNLIYIFYGTAQTQPWNDENFSLLVKSNKVSSISTNSKDKKVTE